MVLPLGPEAAQQLTVIDKAEDGQIRARTVIPVRFGSLETVV
jgi:protein-L-isoaspartate(D-aspartate) O-methyltransferase